jgi:hypothetical protein
MSRKKFPRTKLDARLATFNGCCAACGVKTGGAAGLEWDHVIGLAFGGEDAIDNLEPLCKGCHKAKTKKGATDLGKAKRLASAASGVKAEPAKTIQSPGFAPKPAKPSTARQPDKLAALPRRAIYR